jgi:hypothetical protein
MARRTPRHRKPGPAWRAGLKAALVVPGVLAAALGISTAMPATAGVGLDALDGGGWAHDGATRPAAGDFDVPVDGGTPLLGSGATGLFPFTLLPAPGMPLSAGPTLPALPSGNPFASLPTAGVPGPPDGSTALAAMFGQPVPGGGVPGSANGIPVRAYQAYVAAAARTAQTDPSCRVESDHGRHAGSKVYGDGRVYPPILGIALDGSRSATIHDTDGGRYDGDRTYDRAVGPMQFIPGTWERYGQDGDGNGTRDPQDIDDAALATAAVLCAGPIDMTDPGSRRAAVFRYNHSESYVTTVLAIADGYAAGSAVTIPSAGGLPPVVNPTPPPAATPPDVPPGTVTPPGTPPGTTPPGTTPPAGPGGPTAPGPTTKPTTPRPTTTTTRPGSSTTTTTTTTTSTSSSSTTTTSPTTTTTSTSPQETSTTTTTTTTTTTEPSTPTPTPESPPEPSPVSSPEPSPVSSPAGEGTATTVTSGS